jgi:Tfp pilus assembly protein PilF
MNHAVPYRRLGRAMGAVALPLVLMFGAVACGNDDEPSSSGQTTTDSTADSAQEAADALDAGLTAHSAGDLEEARKQYEKVLELEPTNKFAFYNLALLDEADGNYGLAEQNYRAALTSDPTYEPALFNLAVLRTARNDPDEAISLYRQAIKADKKDAAAWLNLGLLLRENGDKHEGNLAVLKAIALDPSLHDPAKSE